MNPQTQTLDLSSCDREPIQFIASVQSHGVWMAFSPDDMRITNASENSKDIIGNSAADIIGTRIDTLLPEDLMSHVRASLKRSTELKDFFEFSGKIGDETANYDCYLYPSQGLTCLELEPQSRRISASDIQEIVANTIREMNDKTDFASAGKVLAAGVRKLTGMDRVMIYRFMPKVWHGEVIAEDRIASSHAFLGHRFPATDIPKPARDLYLRNRIRYIKSSSSAAAKLTPQINPMTEKIFDLSDSRLRAVPAVHLEYLRNMEVATSFSVAIIVEGSLWGLVACHRFEVLDQPYLVRQACEAITTAYAGRLRTEELHDEQTRHIQALTKVQDFVLSLKDSEQPVTEFMANHRQLADIFNAQGLALVQGNKVDIAGLTPPPESVLSLSKRVAERMSSTNKSWFASNKISEIDERFKEYKIAASGVLALRVPGDLDAIFFLFRPETVHTIRWGGDPRKQLEKRNYQGVINPRVSFETWNEEIQGTSVEWTNEEIRSARFLVDLVFQTFLEKEKLMRELLERSGRV